MCEAVKLQRKGEFSAVGKVSVEEIEKIDEVVKVTSTTSDTVLVPRSSRAVVPETVVENANMGAGKTYKEVNVHGIINTEIDEVDLINHIIYEDKSASKLYMKNADFPQTEHQWAFKQIYKKGSNRVDAINQSEYTLSIVGSENIPSIDSLKSIRVYIFRIDMDTPTLRQAVEQCLGKLREKYPGYNFLAMEESKMSVGLYKYNGNIFDDTEEVLSESIVSQRMYDKYLKPAIEELNIHYFQDGAEIRRNNLDSVMVEIELLIKWVKDNVKGDNLKYLLYKLQNIKKVFLSH